MNYQIDDNLLTDLSVNGLKYNDEFIIQPLGTKISSVIYPKVSESNLINCSNIMFESDDNILSSNQALGWNGLKRIQVVKPKKQWHYCKCGMVIKHTTKATNHKRIYSMPIPYPTKHPRNSVIDQVTKVRGGNYNPSTSLLINHANKSKVAMSIEEVIL